MGEQGLDQRLPLLQLLLLLDHSLQEIQGNLLLLCLRRGGELLLQALHCSSNHLQHLLVELAKAGISQFLDQLHLLLCIRCRLLQAKNDLVYFPLLMGQ